MDLDKFNIARYLVSLPLFTDMDEDELLRIAAGCSLRRYDRGINLFHVGDQCDSFHVVVLGQVKLFVVSAAGNEKVVELLGPGHTFAEAVMFMEVPYAVSAQALEDSLILTVAREVVYRELEINKRFAQRMLASLSRRLHGLIKDVEAYTLRSGVQRVIGYLLSNIDPNRTSAGPASERTTVTLPASKAAIASRLSITPEYFSRVLHELAVARLIHVDRRDILIPDTARLANYHPR